jgi:hypothetical protein
MMLALVLAGTQEPKVCLKCVEMYSREPSKK